MTEADWIICDDLEPLLSHWGAKAGPRKSRLLACAYCRQLWDALLSDASRDAIEVAERYADKLATKRALTDARRNARAIVMATKDPYWARRAAHAALNAVEERGEIVFASAVNISGAVVCNETTREQYGETKTKQCILLRDIFGNPFRPHELDPIHRTPTVVTLARATYDERHLPSGELDPHRLAVLADALEEIGAPGELVAHLRCPGSHVRGCWAVDLCLGLS